MDDLSAGLNKEKFLARFGGVYEHSPWIAEEAFEEGAVRTAKTAEDLSHAMAAVVEAADKDQQLALLRAHPDLAGRLALRGQLTDASSTEQQSAGLDQCSPEELALFTQYNERYKESFGFPFILAVSGRNRAQILDNFRQRLENAKDEEFVTALQEVHKIAHIRIAKILDE